MKTLLITAAFFCIISFVFAQEQPLDLGEVHGNTQIALQQYGEDSLIGARVPDEITSLTTFTNVIYSKGYFSAGLRYETYLNAQLGYPERFNGTGIGYRFVRFQQDQIDITAGNFYEQFGNGLVFRSYEERNLGIDNAIDGVRVIFTPIPGIALKGIYGKQRFNFDSGLINSDGIIRGADAEVNFGEVLGWTDSKWNISVGASGVSKYQSDDRTDLVLPENVAAFAGRFNISYDKVSMFGEYAYKYNDPSADNGYIYKEGIAALINLTYVTRGFYVQLDAKHVDNMSFRTDRNAALTDLNINYLPALTRTHSYNLAATLYPYATQPTGEVAYQAEIGYKFKKAKDTENAFLGKIGGKYGLSITANYAVAFGLDSTNLFDMETTRLGYEAPLFTPGDQKYFSDFNVEIKKKWTKEFKTNYTYFNFVYNNSVNQGAYDNQGVAVKGNVYADIHVLDVSYKLASKHNLRTEIQHLSTNQHLQSWATIVLEYTYSPHWFVAVLDQYNYGNDNVDEQIHYLYGTVGYINGATRVTMGYGKQRAGLFCVGGVCRPVPASNGLTLTITSSF